MDSFFASAEILKKPSLQNKPLVVGLGVVCTANYSARKYGIHSAMPVFKAKKLCPHLITLPVNKEYYQEISDSIQDLVKKITYNVEFISMDEGYVDISDIITQYPSKEYFSNKFRERIFKIIGLTCSVGIGYNKLTAKIASDINKPGGSYIFEDAEEFQKYMDEKEIKKIPGVGKKLQEELLKINVKKIKDIKKYSYSYLEKKYGISRGSLLYHFSRGIDESEVQPIKKNISIGHENTYKYIITTEEDVRRELDELFQKVCNRLIEEASFCRSITLKIKYVDIKAITRSLSFQRPTNDIFILRNSYEALLDEIENFNEIRLLGISLGGLSKKYLEQLKF
jgi:DNA polymerase-4